MAKKTVAVLGAGGVKPGETVYDAACLLGKALAEAGHCILTGGYGGVMAAAAQGAKEAGGESIGVTMAVREEGNPFLTQTIVSQGKGFARQFGGRLGELMAADVLVFTPNGGPGTITELAAALHLKSMPAPFAKIMLQGSQDEWTATLSGMTALGFKGASELVVLSTDEIVAQLAE